MKLKSCAYEKCGRQFEPRMPLQAVCGPLCAQRKARADRERKVKQERDQTRARREAVKRLPDLIAEAQKACNEFIRARDAGLPCICCGKPFEPQRPGGSMDAGHYLARSIAPQHRFNPDNIFGQRKNCNRPGGATRAAFRAGVIDRIGLERVEALEADNKPHHWTREELRAIKATYKAKLKEITQGQSRTPVQSDN
jgi:5-methylcytosine-specific restriction endonuclease McrA